MGHDMGFALMEAVVSLGVGALVTGVTAAAARGSLPRNGGIGIRTPATARSDAAWRAGHRVALPWVVASSVVMVLVALAGAVLTAIGHARAGQACTWTQFGVLLVGLLWSAVLADRAAGRTS